MIKLRTLPLRTERLYLNPLKQTDCNEFVECMVASKNFLHPWVRPVLNKDEFHKYLSNFENDDSYGLVIKEVNSRKIAGMISIGGVLRGALQSAHLGFYLVSCMSGKGYMSEALQEAIPFLFSHLRLHRIESNIQPQNQKSKNLVEKLGFQYEGFSPKFMFINGNWRDHERWAITSDMLTTN